VLVVPAQQVLFPAHRYFMPVVAGVVAGQGKLQVRQMVLEELVAEHPAAIIHHRLKELELLIPEVVVAVQMQAVLDTGEMVDLELL
jgi:hypothetical protein